MQIFQHSLQYIIFNAARDEYKKEQKQLWFEIKKYRKSVLLNGDGRKKARIGAAISFLGYQAMRKIYLKSQRK